MGCREWFLNYAELNYGANPKGRGARFFADCCEAAVQRSNSRAPVRDFAAERGMKSHEVWFAIRSLWPCMRVNDEVRNAVQIYLEEELPFGED